MIVSGKEKTPETESILSNLIPIEHFDSRKNKFSSYLEYFENYSLLKNVTVKGKLAQLLCVSIGSVHYNSLSSYLGPEKPVNKLSYNDPLVKSFKQKMHMPMKSVEVTQNYFLNIYQKENQSVSNL